MRAPCKSGSCCERRKKLRKLMFGQCRFMSASKVLGEETVKGADEKGREQGK